MDKFIVYVPLNIKFPHLGNNTDSKWLQYRLKIFRDYTLKSLINQTDSDFRVAMVCCEESRDVLRNEEIALRRVSPDFMLVKDFYFSVKELYEDSLEDDWEYIYLLKIDSDDMYHKDAIAKCKSSLIKEDRPRLIWFKHGYDYDIRNNKMWYMDFAPSFYGVVIPRNLYNIETLTQYCFCDQTTIRKKYRPEIPFERMYCCLEHGRNIHEDPCRNGNEMKKRCGQFRDVPEHLMAKTLEDFGI